MSRLGPGVEILAPVHGGDDLLAVAPAQVEQPLAQLLAQLLVLVAGSTIPFRSRPATFRTMFPKIP